MKRFLVIVFVLIAIAATMSVAAAAPETAVSKEGPYDGVFHGTVYGPDGSKAAMSLDLTHQGDVVEGVVFLGEGLHIDAGMCGAGTIPASSLQASGETSTANPKVLSTTSTFDVSGIPVKVNLDSEIQGNTLKAKATIDLPWLCGSDPVYTGTLQRA
ncbi:MAG: hypothetical protein P8169_00930 [Chloroflexota bacterium]